MQIKTTVRCHFTPVRIKETRNNKCWWGCGEKETFVHYWWECKLVQPLWKTLWRFIKKLKIELPYDPAIPLLGTFPKKTKTVAQKDVCTLMFIAALFTITKVRRQPKCPSIDQWIKKMWVLLSHEKNEILPFATTWMYQEDIMLSKSDKGR